MILNESVIFSHLGNAERVIYSFCGGERCFCLPIEICRPIKTGFKVIKMFEYDLFLKSDWMFWDLDRLCLGNWLHTICSIIKHHQCTPIMWDSNLPANMALERKCKWTSASSLFGNESDVGIVLLFLLALWINGTISHSEACFQESKVILGWAENDHKSFSLDFFWYCFCLFKVSF